ncbi:MAG TPA: FAD-binding oxidoreductase [Chitinophagaceae bacterium]|nr:FAD-binding oxidoreductase [Chitinophagaceae bacterium]
MALLPWLTGKVIRTEDETYNTRRFWIEIPGTERFDFNPGQFVTLDLPIHEKPNKRWRSYSIASWPDGTNVFELVVVLLEGGAGSTYLFNEVKVGSSLTLRGPLGVFVLHEESLSKNLFLVCTGTGIAPFRSMVQHIFRNNIPHKKIYLIFGCRTRKDLLYYDELRSLELEHFHYIPTLSREEWEGKTGYVHAIYEEFCQGREDAGFFLCGWKNMIDEAKQRILAMGYDKKAIHLELYG